MTDSRRPQRFPITRRRLLQAAPALILPGALASGRAVAQAREPLIFMTWGGLFGKGVRTAFSDPFTKATGIEVRDVTPYNYGRFITAMQNGNPESFDLIWFSDEVEPMRAAAEGHVERLNFDWLPNAAKAIPSAKQDFAVSPYITVYQAAYRSDAYPTPPASWKDFWDVQRFPGPRSLGTWVGGVLEAALMADGVEPDKLYPLDEERAFRMLDKIRPHIRVFHNTSASQQIRQMLLQNEISMVLTWSTDFITAHRAGRPVNVIWNQGFYFSPSVGIPKGSNYTREAHQYLNQFFDPDRSLAFVRAWTTTPAVPEVAKRMTEEERNSTAIGHLEQMVNLKREYYFDNQARLQQKYDSWRVL